MAKFFVLAILLLQLFNTLMIVSGQSPCPQYFTYINDPETNEVMGQVQIPSPPRNVELHLRVALSIGVSLSSKYIGELKLAESKEDSVKAVEEGRSLAYHVHFPLRRPIPKLTGIWFNEQKYCTGPRAVGSIVTTITLEHTLYPPQVIPLSHNSRPNTPTQQNPEVYSTIGPIFTLPTISTRNPNIPMQQNPGVFPTLGPIFTIPTNPIYQTTTRRPTTEATTEVSLSGGIGNNIFLHPSNQNSNDNCGRSVNINSINPLISKGVKTSPGEWPWLVALFVVKREFEFQCAGSILTNRHIISAAHCFKFNEYSNINIPSSTVLVSLGRYQLRDWREMGSINREVANYVLHPDYTHRGNADSDLAIVILRIPVEFSPTIKPICLWPKTLNLQDVVNRLGYVVGWGRDEFGNSYVAEPRMARVPIVSQEDCLFSDTRFSSFTSNRTFCAGLRDGSGPCNGDSGSGLILYDATTDRYQLRGIVSRSLYDRNEMTCDLTQYVVFVDVAKYIDWINRQISTT